MDCHAPLTHWYASGQQEPYEHVWLSGTEQGVLACGSLAGHSPVEPPLPVVVLAPPDPPAPLVAVTTSLPQAARRSDEQKAKREVKRWLMRAFYALGQERRCSSSLL
jgi:hypothetical protein